MQLILITQSGRGLLTLRLRGWRLWLTVGVISLALLAALRLGLALGGGTGLIPERLATWWETSRDDATARELGNLKAKIEQLETTLSILEGKDPDPKSAEVTPPRLEDLELRARKIAFAVEDIATARQRMLENIASGEVVLPIRTRSISSRFGYRTDPFDGRLALHRGIDFDAPAGTPVYNIGAGVVEFIGDAPRYGKMVDIRHSERLVSRHAHLEGIEITSGMPVLPGQRIGRVGDTGRATGAHLHFELILDGRPINPGPFIARLQKSQKLAQAAQVHLASHP
jgi:murein DD-endopeptidase MepM/ murein hydrolase activator NlpD